MYFNKQPVPTLLAGNASPQAVVDTDIISASALLSSSLQEPTSSSQMQLIAPSQGSSLPLSGYGVIKKLQQINGFVSDAVPYVNFGGCAYYAALIRQRLAELGVETKMATIGYYTPPYGAGHVLTLLDGYPETYFHDGIKTIPKGRWEWEYGRDWELLDEDPIKVVDTNRWNEMFDPRDGVPMLVTIIQEVLGSFEKRPHFHNPWIGVEI